MQLVLLSHPQQQSYLSSNHSAHSLAPGPAVASMYVRGSPPILFLKPGCVLQSRKGAALIYKYPILLDACANEMQRKGDAMMAKWAEVMTCMRPKSYFLRPDVAVSLGFAVVREFWNQHVVGRPDLYKAGGKQ